MEVLVPVVTKNGPEKAQGVFRNVTVQPPDGSDPMSYIVPLGYLCSIWQKVCHPSYPPEIWRLTGQSGEGFFDVATMGKNFQCSSATINIVDVPAGADIKFGDNPLIYAAQCAFFISSASEHGFDWGLITPLRALPTVQIGLGISSHPPGQVVPPPQEYGFLGGGFSGVVKVPYTGLLGKEQPVATPVFSSSFVFNIGGKAPKKNPLLSATVENDIKTFMPLQYCNFRSATFFPQDATANGFWWHLKPGVTADITIRGTLVEPGVEASGGEFGSAAFNPMKGEELP